MKKLIFLTLIIISAMSVFCYAEEYNLPAGDLEPLVNEGVVYVDEVTEYTPPLVSTYALTPDWLGNGSRNFYNYIGTLENGAPMQDIYNRLYTPMVSFSYDPYGKMTYYDGDYFLCIDISDIYSQTGNNSETVYNVYKALLQDNPQFFYTGNRMAIFSSYIFNNIYFGISVNADYIQGESRINEADAITEGIAEYDEIIDINMSAYAIEKKIHDKLILDNNYAYDENGDPSDAKYTHSIAGSLNSEYGGGVCESYAKTFQLLLNRYNVDNYYVTGNVSGGGHAWNYVKLDNGSYYCVDTTWDDGKYSDGKPVLGYTYFNMPSSLFYTGRDNSVTPFSESLPQCADDETYYSSAPNLITGKAPNGDYVCQPPDTDMETETRVTQAVTEALTETSTAEPFTETSTEGKIEETTNTGQIIAEKSIKDVIVGLSGTWNAGKFSNADIYYILAHGDGSEAWIVLDEDCYVGYNVQFNGGKFSVYIDNTLISEHTATASGTLTVPKGWHKVRWVYTRDDTSSYGLLYDLVVVSKGDANLDGTVNLLDPIWMLSDNNIEREAFNYLDMDGDYQIGEKDIAAILKKAAGI